MEECDQLVSLLMRQTVPTPVLNKRKFTGDISLLKGDISLLKSDISHPLTPEHKSAKIA